jgi:hypothetical protein
VRGLLEQLDDPLEAGEQPFGEGVRAVKQG